MSEEAVTLRAPPGWFGKLPSLGDFASRRLPPAFVQAWDRWLQRGLAAARTDLGEARWLDSYLVAPVLRFWLAPGVLGEQGWTGLMMPSIDRVGRHFPLTIAQPVESLAAALAARDWVTALDHAARRVLDTAFTVDDFEDALAALTREDNPPADAAAAALAEYLLDSDTVLSVWWCGDAQEGTAFRRFGALPPEGAFAALLGAAP
jgi:type VI secretion system protein ImpM